jgi:hypothetical protein
MRIGTPNGEREDGNLEMEVRKTPSTVELAEKLLREEFSTDDPVSRHNTLLRRGKGGAAALEERRRWAEAWQLLEQARFICREPDESRGSSWFRTFAGRSALNDFEGNLLLAGIRL